MSGQSKKRPERRGWAKLALGAGCVGAAVGAVCWLRTGGMPQAGAEPTTNVPARTAVPAPPAPQPTSDYTNRVVAYLYDGAAITRAELGEYLIARHGADKLDLLINKRILEEACRAQGITVNAAEVENALAEDLKELKVDREGFVKSVLKNYGKNLYEWREDVLRPKLLIAKLVRNKVHYTEEEVYAAFVALYGERVACRMIVWPKEEREKAMSEYAKIRDNPEEFDFVARHQHGSKLASTGGRIAPIGHGTLGNDDVERKVFALRPGEMSELFFRGPDHNEDAFVIKCDQHVPADTSKNLEAVRPQLIKEIVERHVQAEVPNVLRELRERAKPINLLKPPKDVKAAPPPGTGPSGAVALLEGKLPITREELGEFLIERYGAECLDLLINRRIIDDACREKNVSVSDAEVQEALAEDLKNLNVDEDHFIKQVLKGYGKTLFEYKEDAIKPKLLLRKLCQGRVHPTEDDVRLAYEAYYGEQVDCRIILWPRGEERFALMEYAKVRDSEKEFDHKARHQGSGTLAGKGGKIGPIGRHTVGNDEVEREAFRLQPGEVSRLIGTPEGTVVIKCDARIPPKTEVSLESVRPRLVKEIVERKMQQEIPKLVAELRDKAKPKRMLRDPDAREDLKSAVDEMLSEAGGARKPQPEAPPSTPRD
jgi:hypothetical protein